jgi:hypothetical protein
MFMAIGYPVRSTGTEGVEMFTGRATEPLIGVNESVSV